MQKVVQIENISLDELLEKVRSVITPIPIKYYLANTVMITVLNKKDAAKTLNISETFFDKLQSRGIIPTTVHAGFNNKNEPIQRWAQHHLIAIKPVIMQLRHKQSDQVFLDAKKTIHQILGL